MKIPLSQHLSNHPVKIVALYSAIAYGVCIVVFGMNEAGSAYFPGSLVGLFVPVFIWNTFFTFGFALVLLAIFCILADMKLKQTVYDVRKKVKIALVFLFFLTLVFDILIWGTPVSLFNAFGLLNSVNFRLWQGLASFL